MVSGVGREWPTVLYDEQSSYWILTSTEFLRGTQSRDEALELVSGPLPSLYICRDRGTQNTGAILPSTE